MSRLLDTTRFREAEAAKLLHEGASVSSAPKQPTEDEKRAEKRAFDLRQPESLATLATLAPGQLDFPHWQDGIVALRAIRKPYYVKEALWESLLWHATDVGRHWADQALKLGWSAADLFGCNAEPWRSRIDRDGIVMTLAQWAGPLSITSITAHHIALEALHGHAVRFYRHARAGAVPIWRAFSSEGGP